MLRKPSLHLLNKIRTRKSLAYQPLVGKPSQLLLSPRAHPKSYRVNELLAMKPRLSSSS